MMSNKPSIPTLITHPAHYIEGRAFEPISVIEEFGLCHHLACVVKCIGGVGRKTSLLNDLRKAEWCLDREITRYQDGGASCIPPFRYMSARQKPTPKFSEICEDWNLSPHLSKVLSCILDYRQVGCSPEKLKWLRKRVESPYREELDGTVLLLDSMKHLRLAISEAEQGGSK